MAAAPPDPMLSGVKGDPMRDERNQESVMEETGLGLLPGVVGALFIVVLAMTLLFTGSMWAVFGVLALTGLVTVSIVTVVIAIIDEGELGEWLRRRIPGLSPHSRS
jgi:hypothetical protein